LLGKTLFLFFILYFYYFSLSLEMLLLINYENKLLQLYFCCCEYIFNYDVAFRLECLFHGCRRHRMVISLYCFISTVIISTFIIYQFNFVFIRTNIFCIVAFFMFLIKFSFALLLLSSLYFSICH
jgi:hypothetical protein